VVAGVRATLKVVNIATQQVEQQLVGHGGDISYLTVHPTDHNLVLTASKDESLRLLNIKKGLCCAIFFGYKGHNGDVLHCAFNHDGSEFVSCGMDSCIKIWSLSEAATHIADSYTYCYETARLQFQPAIIQVPAFSTNRFHMNYVDCVEFVGPLVLSKSVHDQILLWQPRKYHNKQSMCEDVLLTGFKFQDGDLWFVKFDVHVQTLTLATGTSNGQIFVWRIGEQLENPALLAVLSDEGCVACVRQVSFTGDGKALFACCDDATIWRYDLSELNADQ
jgi:polycomb protein EED